MVFGSVFIEETENYDWWVVEDEYGTDICIRYKETSLMVFPLTMISKRIEDGETVSVIDLFSNLKADLERIRKENYEGA